MLLDVLKYLIPHGVSMPAYRAIQTSVDHYRYIYADAAFYSPDLPVKPAGEPVLKIPPDLKGYHGLRYVNSLTGELHA